MVRFTIITCTYNAAAMLRRTLESVWSQTYEGVDHLIVDGASKDATVEMAENYKQKNDARGNGHTVRVVSEPDRGLYDAMNKGLSLAGGDYLLFLNAGDAFHSVDTLSTLAAMVEGCEPLPAVLYGDTNIVDAGGRLVRRRRLSPPERLTWRSFCRGMLVCHQAFYVRTDIAKATPYDLTYRFSADVDWCIRVMREAARQGLELRNSHTVVADYLYGGMTTANHKASLKERYAVMRKHYGLIVTAVMHLWFIVRAFFKK